jgi:hypothetical protein
MDRRTRTTRPSPKGVALLLVLGIIMAITLLSLGFIARCDVELAAGQNMAVRVQMDQMAASALEHARGLLLNPQDVEEPYWTGDVAQQLDPNTNDFYDVQVTMDPNDECTFDVTCGAYRHDRHGRKIGAGRLSTVVRLDPAIGLWTGADLYVRDGWSLVGDVYTAGILTNPGLSDAVHGDVFAAGLNGDIVGTSADAATLTLAWPPVTSAYSHPTYATTSIGPGAVSGTYASAAIRECTGTLVVRGAATLHGMLLVDGDLVIEGAGVRITAAKNLPAIYVTGNLILHGATDLRIEGLVVVEGKVLVGHGCANAQILGGLFAGGEIVEATLDSSGYANDAILRNIPTWPSSGALELDGVNQYAQTPDDDTRLQLIDEYTLSVWLKPGAVQNAWAGILCKTDPAGDRNHWVLQVDSTATELIVGHDTTRWSTGILLAGLAEDQWHHIAVVRQADGMMTSYLGGTMIATLDPNVAGELAFKNRKPDSGLGHLKIGVDRTGSSSFVYKGLLDDIRVYNRALSVEEVEMPPDDPSLIGHWTFDEGGSQIDVVASPTKAAIAAWPSGTRMHWSPAAGAFFQDIYREFQ